MNNIINIIHDKFIKFSKYSIYTKYILPNYTNILYVLGFGWNKNPIYISNDSDDYNDNGFIISVTLNNNNIDITEKVIVKKYNILFVLNILYNFFLSILILWPLVYSIVLSIIEYNFEYITDNLFQLLFITQYISGSIYFSKDHLYNILRINYRKPFTYTFWIYVSLFFSLIFTVITAILFNLDYEIVVYTSIIKLLPYTWAKVIFSILLFIEKFFCYLCFFVNMITFCYVQTHHKVKMSKLSDKLDSYNSNRFSFVVGTVTEDFFKVRTEHNSMIENLNYIFSTANITGLLALYFTIKNINNNQYLIMEIINISIFLLIEIIYLYTINKVKRCIDIIKEKMVSISYISQILNKRGDIPLIKNNNENENEDIDLEISHHSRVSAIASVKTSETLDWIIMKEILDSEWETFKFLGFPITDSYIIQKIFGIIITLLIAKDISESLSIYS